MVCCRAERRICRKVPIPLIYLRKEWKKVGEECTEVIIAGKGEDKKETVYELADLAYHAMVLMVEMGISLEDVHRELAARHIIDHKVKQEKMTK